MIQFPDKLKLNGGGIMRELKAEKLFNDGCNCSQAVLASFCDEYGLDTNIATNLSVTFGGGLGRQGKICGCLSGALMVLGLHYGNDSTNNKSVRIENYDMAKDFCRKFKEINGGMDCKDIIKLNLANLEDRQKAHEQNVFKIRCTNVVKETVLLLENYLISESLSKKQK